MGIFSEKPDANATLAFAARELKAHLALLPESAAQGLCVSMDIGGEGDYSYRVYGKEAQFTGSTPGNVLLAVYDYLRAIGFVFLYPGENGTCVPNLQDGETLNREKQNFTGSFFHRGVCVEGADSLETALNFIDWLPKNGFNAFFLQFKKPDIFFERWYSHTYNPTLPPETPTREQLDEMDRQVYHAMELRGIHCHRVGHGWTAEALGCPGTGWRTAAQEPDPDQQELIALADGKRTFWKGVPANTNLCYSNPRARQLLVNQVVDYARENPQTDYLHFWLADDYNNVCTCEKCCRTTVADQYVEILNEIDKALTAAGLSAKIVFLLYQELLYAPLKSRISNPERFCLMFAPISRTFEKSYPKTFTPVPITPYVRNAMRLPETVEENLSHLVAWKRIFSGDSFFYDYPLGRAHYGDFGYMKIARVIYDDIHALKAFGANGYMSCQELRAMTPTSFPNYVMGQALLDETQSYETLKETYFSAMFGSQWEKAAAFLEQLSDLSDTDYFNNHGPRYQPALADKFREIVRLSEEFRKELPEQQTACLQKNWEYLDFHCRYCALLAGALAELCEGHSEEANRRFAAFCAFIRSQELTRQQRLDVYRVIEVATHYTGFSLPEGK